MRMAKAAKTSRKVCLATLLQIELNSDVARFTTHIKPVLQHIRLLTGFNVGGKTHNIAIQLVLQQCCKTSCTFFVARFSVPLRLRLPGIKRTFHRLIMGPFRCSVHMEQP